MPTYLTFERQRESCEKGFRGGIKRCVRRRLHSCHRGHVNDATLPLVHHRGQQQIGQLNHGSIVQMNHFELTIQIQFAKLTLYTEPGIVYQQIYLQLTVIKLFDQLLPCPGYG